MSEQEIQNGWESGEKYKISSPEYFLVVLLAIFNRGIQAKFYYNPPGLASAGEIGYNLTELFKKRFDELVFMGQSKRLSYVILSSEEELKKLKD